MSVLILGVLMIGLHFIIASPKAQQSILRTVTKRLSKELQTNVTVDSVAFIPYGKLSLFSIDIPTPEDTEFIHIDRVNVSILSFDFWKKQFHPKHVQIKGALINLERAPYTNEWNFSFLKKEPQKNKTKKDWNWSFSRGEFDIDDAHFIYEDSLKGNIVDIQVSNTLLRFQHWLSDQKSIKIRSVRLDRPDVYVAILNDRFPSDYDASSEPLLEELIREFKHDLFNPGFWDVDITKVKLINGNFQLRYEEEPFDEHLFDYRNLAIKDIEVELRDLTVRGDTIDTDIAFLKARERSGLEIQSLVSHLIFHPNETRFENIDLHTNYSYIDGDFIMSYPNFYAFFDYNYAVYLTGDIRKGSTVAWKDLNYFASALNSFNHNVTSVEGAMEGYVSHLKGNNIKAWDGINNVISDVEIIGLPETDITTYDFRNMDIAANGMGLSYYVPGVDLQSFSKNLSHIDIKGNLLLSEQFLNLEVDVNSNQGALFGTMELLNPYEDYRVIKHSDIDFNGFNVGFLMNEQQVVQLNGKAIIDEINTPRGDQYVLNSQWSRILWGDTNIDHIHFNAKGDMSLWKGQLLFDNHIGDVATQIQYKKEDQQKTIWTISQDLSNVAVNQLTSSLAESEVVLSGKWNAIISQLPHSTQVNFETIYLKNKHNNLPYHQIYADYIQNDQQSSLILNSDDIDLSLVGQWDWKTLINIPAYLKYEMLHSNHADVDIPETTDFSLALSYEDTDGLIPDLIPAIKTEGQQIAAVNFNAFQDLFTWQVVSPLIQWKGISLNGLKLIGQLNQHQLQSNTTAKEVGFYNIEWLKDWTMDGHSTKDGILFDLQSAGSEHINALNMKAILSNENDGYMVNFLPSSFKVKSETWHFPLVYSDFHILFSDEGLTFNELIFESEKQRFKVETKHSLRESLHRIQIQNLNLNLLNGFIEAKDYEINGSLNGDLVFSNHVDGDLLVYFDIDSKDLNVQEHQIGAINSVGYLDFNKQFLKWTKNNILGHETDLSWTGDFYWNNVNKNDLDINIQQFPIAITELFLGNVLEDLDGQISGNLHLGGLFNQPIWNGALTANDATFRPSVTGVHYTIPEANINVHQNHWDIPATTVLDEKQRTAIGRGTIKSNSWNDWHLALEANTERAQLIDLKNASQAYYYGDINGKAFFSLEGPLDHIVVRVNASPMQGSKLFIPIQSESDVNQYNYIQFREKTENPISYNAKNSKIDFYLQSSFDTDLEVNLILDETVKDKITARGNGYIQMSSDAQNPFKMNGTYTIEQGTYDFVFRQLEVINFKKQFIIQPNSVIKWDGDPWNALLDVKGTAIVKARLYDLISSEADRMNLSNQEIRDAQTPQSVLVNLEMKGMLNNPEFDFNLALEEGRSLGTLAYQRLQKINQDTRILLNQVGSLLLLEQFVPNEGLTNASIASGSLNNMTEIVSSAASSQITNFANKVLGMDDLEIGLKYKNYNFMDAQELRGMQYLNRNEAGIQLRKNFLSNRLRVEVGGSYDWGRTEAEKYTTDFMGDFRIQYFITDDGKLRLNAFRNSQFDVLYGKSVSRQGIGIGYKRSFNHLNIFKNSSENIKKESTTNDVDSLDVSYKSTNKSI